MKAAIWIFAIVVAVILAIGCPPGFAQEPEKPWAGKFGDGTVIDANDLQRILAEHRKWLRKENGGKQANLQGADLYGANLERAWLMDANLKGARLSNANLQGAKMERARLQGALLLDANISGADLVFADLKGAWLSNACLAGAKLNYANLQGADLNGARLQNVVFEIEPNKLPNIRSIARAENLSSLRYLSLPDALFEIRSEFKKYGLRRQEREITYALKHSGYLNAMTDGNLETKFQVLAGRLLFDLPCQWGMAPMRPLKILFIGIGLFAPIYVYSLIKKKKQDGIWKTWIPERSRQDLGSDVPELLACGWKGAIGLGIYFSVLSAFQVGWKDLNVGSWIARMQPREYRLHASGWVRFVSGLQSLISVYLLALCVLSYFGRPFEGY
ncbi:hypothetical protein DSCO28_13810 [Desulfosarcina ovata subsp. sediminis]|uniref:Pentapeptide repeat-containing protein n=1 Tax=Desulfosarcina ovata subsp. sediminis TaxID=885957 RepID=A0A5K7ZKP0_9BACT|nr:pentapeptide repeat-containing protein [Desulfosarcina ovata]BBO80815.1 hypothetical protein DSCO28_13810 [Desulfosarcina ovata subsp. sediminis]